MKAIIRKDEQAVSPVIATILMVAITVVLAAVLYVMVSGLLVGPGGGPRAMAVDRIRSTDGTNWVLTIISAPSGLTTSLTSVTIQKPDGTSNLTTTSFANLNVAPYEGGQFVDSGTVGTVDATDVILLKTSWYLIGARVTFSDATGIMYAGTLQ